MLDQQVIHRSLLGLSLCMVLGLAACKSPVKSVSFANSAVQTNESPVGDVSAQQDLAAIGSAWFSSNKATVEPLVDSDDLRKGLTSEVGLPVEVTTPGRMEGYVVDLDRNGTTERIVRATGKDGMNPEHLVFFLVDGEWELVDWFKGEFLLVKRAAGWPDDIVVASVDAKSGDRTTTAMKFNGIRYRDVWELRENRNGRKLTRVSSDPVVPPPVGAVGDWVSPIVGDWMYMSYSKSGGPESITTVSINEDGVYHLLEIGVIPSEKSRGDEAQYDPIGAELERHETGRIDLRTGREILPSGSRSVAMRSIHWEVIDGELHWNMDMGTMGGQGVTYRAVH